MRSAFRRPGRSAARVRTRPWRRRGHGAGSLRRRPRRAGSRRSRRSSRPGPKTSATPSALSSSASSGGIVPPTTTSTSSAPFARSPSTIRGHQRHVRAGEDRDADGVRVLLDRGLDDLLRRLVEPRVDDLHARVPQGSRDDLRAAVVAVETGLRDDHSYRARHMRQNTAVRLTVIGSSPAWPNPGSAHSGYMLQADGSRVLARLRAWRPRPAARAARVAGRRRDRDHALAPRPLGRPRAVGLGQLLPRARTATRPAARALGSARRRASSSTSLGERLGFPDMFERTFDLSEYEPDTPFASGSSTVTPTRVPHYRLETYAFRVQSNGSCARVLGRLRAVRASSWKRHAMPISSCARRRSSEASSTASPAATSRSTRPWTHSSVGRATPAGDAPAARAADAARVRARLRRARARESS